jgi:serine/threonine protein kinase
MEPQPFVRVDQPPPYQLGKGIHTPVSFQLSQWSYKLEKEPLAKGGQGEVYLATRSDGLKVAIKLATGATSHQALQHEIRMLRSLEQAGVLGVVQCLDVIDVDDRMGMVMNRYDNDLGSWLKDVSQNPSRNSFDDILQKMAILGRTIGRMQGVSVADDVVVHRDIKPENIFMTEDGRIALGDFGGALAITSLEAVELSLFGTPMWAPLDQILPGKTIPDPTWDTYAACVMLYAAITGSRPAYQADPRALLTPAGRRLWNIATEAIKGQGLDSQTKREVFIRDRGGTTASDLVDLTGASALIATDKKLLNTRIEMLASKAGVSQNRVRILQTGIWNLLCRGLSPVSHPSPPNRYRDGNELAENLEDLRDLLDSGVPPTENKLKTLLGLEPPDSPMNIEIGEEIRNGSSSSMVFGCWATAIIGLCISLSLVLGVFFQLDWFLSMLDLSVPSRVSIPAQSVMTQQPVDAFEGRGKDLIGLEVLVKSNRLKYSGEERLVFHYQSDTRIKSPVVTLTRNNASKETMDITLPDMQAGIHYVSILLTSDSGLDSGLYDVKYKNGRVTSLVKDRVTGAGNPNTRSVAFADWTTSKKNLVSVFYPQTVAALEMDRCEVSNTDWQACMVAGHCAPPVAGSTQDNVPVTVETIEKAQAYCEWKGGTLPTVLQWKAAAGTTRFPWGEADPNCSVVNGLGCENQPRPTCSTPLGKSVFNVEDMAGNVREWCWSNNMHSEARIMGGGYQSSPSDLGAQSMLFPPEGSTITDTGLRCVYPEREKK